MPVKHFYISLWILFSFWALASFWEICKTNLSEWEKRTSRIDLFVVDFHTIHFLKWWILVCPDFPNRLTLGCFKALLSFIDIPYEISNLKLNNLLFSTFVKSNITGMYRRPACIHMPITAWSDFPYLCLWCFLSVFFFFLFLLMKGKNINSKSLLPPPPIFLSGLSEDLQGKNFLVTHLWKCKVKFAISFFQKFNDFLNR